MPFVTAASGTEQTALQAFVESLLHTAIASVTASSSSLPKWPQNTELMKLIRNIISWAKNWKERRAEVKMKTNHHSTKEEHDAALPIPQGKKHDTLENNHMI